VAPPGSPCAPALLAVPNGSAGIPLPLLNPDDYIPDPTPAPTYSDIVNSTLGDLGSDADGFDAAVGASAALIDLWDAAATAQDADLDAILLLLDQADTAPATQSFTDFESGFAADSAAVQGVGALALPDYGSLPTSWVQPGAVQVTPPGVTPGTPIHVGDPQFTWRVQLELPAVRGATNFAPTAKLAFGNTGVIVSATQAYYADTGLLPALLGDYVDVVVNPTKAGTVQDAIVVTGAGIVGAPTFSIFVTVAP
jgi:hypothetical protein